jgi:hypothetical protein
MMRGTYEKDVLFSWSWVAAVHPADRFRLFDIFCR